MSLPVESPSFPDVVRDKFVLLESEKFFKDWFPLLLVFKGELVNESGKQEQGG